MGIPSWEDLNEQLREELRLEQEMLDHLIDKIPPSVLADYLNLHFYQLLEADDIRAAVRNELKRVIKDSECCPTCGQAMKGGE